ncbi:glycosyltransferase family 39 protein [Nocardioides sp. S-58]|uniref:Glycosyltransferase family 39 protein n=1 Tax=Nocardioides renjunii TaxID=3095075 RepID=A0ABU5K6B8_9ACTN|nr:glycosyltransferase family 39 protein [Nocardioides sp. S-58]MDZ5660155.1 glycosyltransferase family 39 protein [Nocardioides sp. S-58]
MLTRPRWALAALLAIIGVSFAFVAVHVESYTRLSPIDELSHLDYMFRAPAVLAPGDKVEQQAMYEQACRGVDAPGFDPVLCDRDHEYDADIYQEHGFNTAATNTPIYYTATRAVAEVVRALTPTGSLFVAGRLASGIWLALGLALVYLAGRRAGIRPAPLLAVLALLPASPAILYPSATVTPDAMGLVAGALVVLAALAWERRPDRVRTAVLVLVCVLVPLIKLTNIVAVAALVFYLAFNRHRQAASERRSDEDATDGPDEAHPIPARQRWTTGAVGGAAAVVAGGAWTVISNSRNHADPDDVPDMAVRFAVTEFPWNGLLDSALIMAQPLSQPWVGVGTPSLLFFTTTVVSLVLIAGTAAAAFFSTGTPRATVAARAMLAAAVLVALGLVTMGYVTASQYFPLPARYGVALVPGMVLVTAGMLRTRSSVAITAGLAVVVLVFTAARVIGLP